MRQTQCDDGLAWKLLAGSAAHCDQSGNLGFAAAGVPGVSLGRNVVSAVHRVADGADVSSASNSSSPRTPTSTKCMDGQPVVSNVVDKVEVCPSLFSLPPDVVPAPPVRWDILGTDAFVLDGVLTEEECQLLIEQAEGHWTYWDSSKDRATFRNCDTVEVHHGGLADRIWGRVEAMARAAVEFAEDDPRFEVDLIGRWEPDGMNPRLLFGRYVEGGHFAPHTDGTTVDGINRRTMYTGLLYLNESPWGGQTRIYDDEQIHQELVEDKEGRLTGDEALVVSAVDPKPGRMLIFYHRLMHEAAPAGLKYIIRSDMFYRRCPGVCTQPEDVEAFAMYQEAQLLAEHGRCEEAAALFRRAFKTSEALTKLYKC